MLQFFSYLCSEVIVGGDMKVNTTFMHNDCANANDK